MGATCDYGIVPPITVTEEQLDLALGIMEEAFRSTPGTMPLFTEEIPAAQQFGVEARL
jgi:hypothetical protein